MRSTMKCLLAALVVATSFVAKPAGAAEKVTVGVVGSGSALIWLYYIAKEKALFEKEGLAIDLVSVSSSSDSVRQLSAGSLNFVIGGGLIDPIRAAGKGADVAIARIEGQAPPYALMGKKDLTGLKDLKGKIVSVGGVADVTKVYVERMVASVGLGPKDVDFVYAGATAPRFSALQSGAVDAAILAPPFNFVAAASGFVNLGDVAETVKDLPFSGDQVNKRWASENLPIAKKFLSAYGSAIAWFYDDKNRDEAVSILVKYAKASESDAQHSYAFFRKIRYFEQSDKISKKQLNQLFATLKQFGEDALPTAEQMVLPGLTQLTE